KRRVRGVRVGEVAAGIETKKLRGGELRRERNAEEKVVEAGHERRQRLERIRLGVDIALEQRDEDRSWKSVPGDVRDEEVHQLVLQEVVVEIAGERFARDIGGADLDVRSAERAVRNERFLNAPGNLQVACDLVIQLAELVLIPLHAQQCPEARQQNLGVGALGDEIVSAGFESFHNRL